jgi:hypothetical protein
MGTVYTVKKLGRCFNQAADLASRNAEFNLWKATNNKFKSPGKGDGR